MKLIRGALRVGYHATGVGFISMEEQVPKKSIGDRGISLAPVCAKNLRTRDQGFAKGGVPSLRKSFKERPSL